MITGWTIYWITRLDSIGTTSVVFAIICGVATIISLVVCGAAMDERDKDIALSAIKHAKRFAMAFVPFLLLSIFTPSSKVAAAMYVVPAIVNNQKVQEIPQNLLDLSNAWIKEQTKKIAGDKNEKD